MNANQTSDQPLDKLNARVKSVWLRSQKLHALAGLFTFCRWVIVLFIAAVLMDWLIDLPSFIRVGLLIIILAVSLYQAWKAGWSKVQKFNAARAAMQIEEHHGNFESILVTAIQFRESKIAPGASQSLQDFTCRQAEEAVASVQPQKVVLYNGLRRPLTYALVLAAVIAAFGAFNAPFLGAGIARILPPWSSVAYPTRTQLELASAKIIVQEGTPAVITARVKGVIPSQARLELRTGKGEPRNHDLDIIDGQCEYTIKAAFRGFEYRIIAGDAKSPWQEVEVISSPQIKQAKVSLEYPAYTKREVETVESLTLTVPEGTNIHWQLSLDRAVSKAIFTPAGGEPKPLEVSEDGFTVSMREPATESRGYSFSWVEKSHGFAFTSSNHYLQVAPDQAPRVELTSPVNNLYATLGRKLDLAYRGRDDHGIGEAHIAYRVNKIEEAKVPFTSSNLPDGGEQIIDWDYRTVLPDLAIGDTVSFVVEIADAYPGAKGPHRSRSQARNISFLSEANYLRYIDKQKQQLLYKLRTIYREERKVHETFSKLDPTAPEFGQTCQIEAVRQDLMGERLGVLEHGIKILLDDIAANNITDKSVTAILVSLHADIQKISSKNVINAANRLRELGAAAQKKSNDLNPSIAINAVDNVAREMACMVLQIGFMEATEVMARELHAIAETQAKIRLQTILSEVDAATLAKNQEELSQWVTRLFSSIPADRESTIEDALVAFNLSRLVKGLRQAGVETKMPEAAVMIRKTGAEEIIKAVVLQAEVIEALLYAEFRLRAGSEQEALTNAAVLFASQVNEQKTLRESSSALTPEQFKQRREDLAKSQSKLQNKLQLLLMPAIPAHRSGLFDTVLPAQPPVAQLLANADNAMKMAATHIDTGDQKQAASEQQKAEQSFSALSNIISKRLEDLSESFIVSNLSAGIAKHAADITELEERQLSLIEKTEDAEDDTEAAHLALLQEKLTYDIGKLRLSVIKWNKEQVKPTDAVLPLLSYIDELESSATNATTALKDKNIDDSIDHQETTLKILEEATKLLANQLSQTGSLSLSLSDARTALRPAPFVSAIQAEQLDLVKLTANAKPDQLPHLAIVQKNLIHAVNAVLEALDPLSHQIESGTVFVFAKDDMDAAATAIEDNDLVEAADAGEFVAETLQGLSNELTKVTPRYSYILEINEFFHKILVENDVVRMQQIQLQNKLGAAKDDAAVLALVAEQSALEARFVSYAQKIFQVTGQENHATTLKLMAATTESLKANDRDTSSQNMRQTTAALTTESERLTLLMELLANVLKPPVAPEVSPETIIVLEILALASDQKVTFWKTQTALDEDIKKTQLKLAERGELLAKNTAAYASSYIPAQAAKLEAEFLQAKAKANANAIDAGPPLEELLKAQQARLLEFFATNQKYILQANQSIANAAAKLQSGATKEAILDQQKANDSLRFLLLAYVDELLVPVAPGSSDPVPSDPTESLTDSMMMFMPGAVSGDKPKGGRQEWEVLGKRERAALNENFARELPLEYRAVLKDYYEKLAQ